MKPRGVGMTGTTSPMEGDGGCIIDSGLEEDTMVVLQRLVTGSPYSLILSDGDNLPLRNAWLQTGLYAARLADVFLGANHGRWEWHQWCTFHIRFETQLTRLFGRSPVLTLPRTVRWASITDLSKHIAWTLSQAHLHEGSLFEKSHAYDVTGKSGSWVYRFWSVGVHAEQVGRMQTELLFVGDEFEELGRYCTEALLHLPSMIRLDECPVTAYSCLSQLRLAFSNR